MESISTFASEFSGGARAYLFYIATMPYCDSSFKYYARSTSLPGDDVDEIVVNWMGSELKFAGGKKFADWTVTIECDRNYDLRSNFVKWMDDIHETGKEAVFGEPSKYKKTIIFKTVTYTGGTNKTITLEYAWPKSVGPIALDHGSQEIARFDVTFNYAWHTIK
jgi:hypothetical protein